MSDFESACIKAIKNVFPQVRNSACFFHLMQSFRRQADQHGLRTTLNNSKKLMFQYKKLKAISLVPLEDIYKIWDAMIGTFDARLNPLVQWLETYYIGKLILVNAV